MSSRRPLCSISISSADSGTYLSPPDARAWGPRPRGDAMGAEEEGRVTED